MISYYNLLFFQQYEAPEWKYISNTAKDLVMKMLAHNPKKRLTIQDVLAHPWMSDREKVHRTHLPETVESLKVFNSKRKLKASVQSIAGGITADSMFGTDTDISKCSS